MEIGRIRKLINLIPSFIYNLFLAVIITVFLEKGFPFLLLVFFALLIIQFTIGFVVGFFLGKLFRFRWLKKVSQGYYDFLKQNDFPKPDVYTDHPVYYFEGVMNNSKLPTELRIKAAMEYAQITMLKQINIKTLLIIILFAWEKAIEDYNHYFVSTKLSG